MTCTLLEFGQLPLGRTVNKDETAGGPWRQSCYHSPVIKTNPKKLSQFQPYDKLSTNEFEVVREQVHVTHARDACVMYRRKACTCMCHMTSAIV